MFTTNSYGYDEQASEPNSQHILSVHELSSQARTLLENQFGYVLIEGEISNLAQPRSGHIYLTLKDDQAQIRAAFFKQSQRGLTLDLQDGQKVLVKAKVSLYVPRGDYQLIIQHIEAAGAGQLQQAFEKLKKKLEAAGLFRAETKQSLPVIPQSIGIITSASAAALQDILHVLKRRFPATHVIIYPTLVQGKDAAQDIAKAIQTANQRQEVDLLIVGRGGGSLEDLWSFNEEIVAQAIFDSRLPIISAVGHQTDFTIADFVADLRAPTPSAAAELSVPDQTQLYNTFVDHQQHLSQRVLHLINHYQQRLDALSRHIRHPSQQIQEQSQRLDELEQRLIRASLRSITALQNCVVLLHQRLLQQTPKKVIDQQRLTLHRLTKSLQQHSNRTLNDKRIHLENLYQRLTGISPTKTLERGYAIAQTQDGTVIDRAHKINVNDTFNLRFIDQTISVKMI